jgi:uncharacterized protein YvpB
MRAHPRLIIGIFGLSLLGVGILLVLAGRFITPSVTLVSPVTTAELALEQPLRVRLSVPAARRLIEASIEPTIEGTWQWEGGINNEHFARTLTFTPEEIWAPEEEYKVVIKNVRPLLGGEERSHVVSFMTKALPVIVAASVQEGESEQPPQEPISLTLDQPPSDTIDFTFSLSPEATINVTKDPVNQRYVIEPVEPLRQGQEYLLKAEREVVRKARATGEVVSRFGKEIIFERLFRTKTPPAILAHSPQGSSVLPQTDQFKIHFSLPMVRGEVDAGIRLEPAEPGAWEWLNDSELIFKFDNPLKIEQVYKITLPPGIHAVDGSYFEEPTTLSFSTVGALKVNSFSPSAKTGIPIGTVIRLGFDQPPEPDSVMSKLSVSPQFNYSSSWQGNMLTLKPSEPLSYATKYTVTLSKGAKSLFGRDARADYVATFTTEEKVVLLNVPWDRQDRALSCEAAALKMALSAKGVFVSEGEIMDLVGYDPTPHAGNTWGDPDQAFVGDINGAQNSTGYGVHWGPIARAASAWRPSVAVLGMTVHDVARELEAGNAVVFWGVTGSAYYDPWFTPSGKKVEAWKGEHTRTLIGYRGSIDNPTSFIINDPQSGRVTWSTSKLKSNWATFGFGAVIVR